MPPRVKQLRRFGGRTSYSLEEKEKLVLMMELGWKNCDIRRATGVPESTIRTFRKTKDELKKYIIKARRGTQPHNTRAPNPRKRERERVPESVRAAEAYMNSTQAYSNTPEPMDTTDTYTNTPQTSKRPAMAVTSPDTFMKTIGTIIDTPEIKSGLQSLLSLTLPLHGVTAKRLLVTLTEHVLVNWLSDYQGPFNNASLQARAYLIYQALCRKAALSNPPSFIASGGWVNKFKKRAGIVVQPGVDVAPPTDLPIAVLTVR